MAATMEQLAHDVLTLSESDRARLAKTILDSLESETEAGVEEAWNAEVTWRLERVQQGTAQGRPADDVFRDIRARYQP